MNILSQLLLPPPLPSLLEVEVAVMVEGQPTAVVELTQQGAQIV